MTAIVLVVSAPAVDAHSVLRRGDTGHPVLLWQKMLNLLVVVDHEAAAGLIAEDGLFGPETEQATIRFEESDGFERDGVVGTRERVEWLGGFVTCCGAEKPPLARGSYSPDVGLVQQNLNKWLRSIGASPLTIDLFFGPATETAVRQFQAAHGLAVDGVVGRETWGEFLGWPKP